MSDQEKIENFCNIPIKEVADRLGMKANRYGFYLCPMHNEEQASLKLYGNNTFFCFGCRSHGKVIDLVKGKLGTDFKGACRWLEENFSPYIIYESGESTKKKKQDSPFDATKYGWIFEKPTLNDAARMFLFHERHLSPMVIGICRISSWIDNSGRPQLQIPYFDTDGKLIGAQWRNLSRDGPRFRFPKGSHQHIYNMPIFKQMHEGDKLYIAEGTSDCWSLLSAGHNAIAIPSATLLRTDELALLRGYDLHMYPDNDYAGETLYNEICRHVNVTRHPLPEGCKDYSDYYVKHFKYNKI